MTRIEVDPGICGFKASIEVRQTGRKQVSVNLLSDCKQVKKFASLLDSLECFEVFKHGNDSKVNKIAIQCQLHPSCPVPVSIFKAVEVEAGLAIAKNIHITFVNDERGHVT